MSQPVNTSGRRPSLTHVGLTTSSGRKQSLGGFTPMIAAGLCPSDIIDNRRGSLRVLAHERELSLRIAQELQERSVRYREGIAKLLSSYKIQDILPCISKDKESKLIEIDASLRPVDAFEILLENNIESAPVYQRVSVPSANTPITSTTPITPTTPTTPTTSITSMTSTTSISSPITPTTSTSTITSPIITKSPTTSIPLSSSLDHHTRTSIDMSAANISTRATPTAIALRTGAFVRSLSAGAPSLSSLSSIPPNRCGKEYTGFLDIRDLVSSMILVSVQPINEDDLVFTSTGAEVPVDTTIPSGLEELSTGAVGEHSNQEVISASQAMLRATNEAILSSNLELLEGNDDDDDDEDRIYSSSVPTFVHTLSGFDEQLEDSFDLESSNGNVPSSSSSIKLSDLSETSTINAINPIDALAAIKVKTEGGEVSPSISPISETETLTKTKAETEAVKSTTATATEAEAETEDAWTQAINRGLNKFAASQPTTYQRPLGNIPNTSSNTSNTSAITVSYLSRRNTYRPLVPSATLFEAATLFSHGANRVPVVDENGECIDIIFLRDMIQFLYQHLSELSPEIISVRACDLMIGSASVKEIPESFEAIEAFLRLDQERISGIAIVDDERKFLNATSSRDLKLFALDKEKTSLNLPILEYLAKIRGIENIKPFEDLNGEEALLRMQEEFEARFNNGDGDFDDGDGDGDYDFDMDTNTKRDYTGLLSGAITTTQHVSVRDVITELATANVTRAFCLDDDDVPTRVIAVSDILKFACGISTL